MTDIINPGETKIVKVQSGDWERPKRFHIFLPSEWVKRYTEKGAREVELKWVGDRLEIRPIRTGELSQ